MWTERLLLQDASGEQDPKQVDANSIEEEAAAAHLTALRNTGRYSTDGHAPANLHLKTR